MPSFVRSILIFVAACVASGIIVALVEGASSMAFPAPPGVAMSDPGFMDQVPLGGKIGVLVAWTLGPIVGGYIAARWAPRAPLVLALAVGVVFFVADALNLVAIPSPPWMVAVGLAAPLPAAWLGAQIALGPSGAPTRPA